MILFKGWFMDKCHKSHKWIFEDKCHKSHKWIFEEIWFYLKGVLTSVLTVLTDLIPVNAFKTVKEASVNPWNAFKGLWWCTGRRLFAARAVPGWVRWSSPDPVWTGASRPDPPFLQLCLMEYPTPCGNWPNNTVLGACSPAYSCITVTACCTVTPRKWYRTVITAGTVGYQGTGVGNRVQ